MAISIDIAPWQDNNKPDTIINEFENPDTVIV